METEGEYCGLCSCVGVKFGVESGGRWRIAIEFIGPRS